MPKFYVYISFCRTINYAISTLWCMLLVSGVEWRPHQPIGYIKSQIIGDNLNLLGLLAHFVRCFFSCVKIPIYPTIYKSSLTIVLRVYATQNFKYIESPFYVPETLAWLIYKLILLCSPNSLNHHVRVCQSLWRKKLLF